MKRLKQIGLGGAALLALLLCACRSELMLVQQAPDQHKSYSTITLEPEPPTIYIPRTLQLLLDDGLKKRIYDGDTFKQGGDLLLRYRIVQFDRGSRAARAFALGTAGQGTITVEATYLDAAGNTLARTQYIGVVSGGTWGGSSRTAARAVVDEVAKGTIKMFK